MTEFMTWLAQQSPGWIFMIFPLLFGSIALSCWRDHRKLMKKEADPRLMSEAEYKHLNRKRFKEI